MNSHLSIKVTTVDQIRNFCDSRSDSILDFESMHRLGHEMLRFHNKVSLETRANLATSLFSSDMLNISVIYQI
jgi:hypothetical protein